MTLLGSLAAGNGGGAVTLQGAQHGEEGEVELLQPQQPKLGPPRPATVTQSRNQPWAAISRRPVPPAHQHQQQGQQKENQQEVPAVGVFAELQLQLAARKEQLASGAQGNGGQLSPSAPAQGNVQVGSVLAVAADGGAAQQQQPQGQAHRIKPRGGARQGALGPLLRRLREQQAAEEGGTAAAAVQNGHALPG
jgi:hypothetical protein